MKKQLCILLMLSFSCLIHSQEARNKNHKTNHAQQYTALQFGAIKAEGWLKKMLEIQYNGLTGNLDEVYEVTAGDNNGWLDGTGDSWERGPYWLDSLTQFVYLLEDEKLIAKVKKWVNWSIKSQHENGYFGPIPITKDTPRIRCTQQTLSEDWWPKMLMLKVLQQYYSATSDEQALTLMDKYFIYMLKELPNGELMHQQTFDWTDIHTSDTLSVTNPYAALHYVNVAKELKAPVIYYQQSKNQIHLNAPIKGLEALKNGHRFAYGMYGGDEAMNGSDPIQGSELCSTHKMMYSLESMLSITENTFYADYLEKIAYNVLPFQHNDDFTKKQYFQQANQIKATHDYRNFVDEHGSSNTVFGVRTGYPCCVSNMHQGCPKLLQNLFYATAENGVTALVYTPSNVKILVADNINLYIEEGTNYPFEDTITFKVNPDRKTAFTFELLVHSWFNNPEVITNGEKIEVQSENNMLKINRTCIKKDFLIVHFPIKIKTSGWYEKSVTVERGPLLYALKIKENCQEKKEKQWSNSYYEVSPESDWIFGITYKALEKKNFAIKVNQVVANMSSNLENARSSIITIVKRIPYWTEYNNSINVLGNKNLLGAIEEDIKLIPPYSSTLYEF